MGLFNLIKKHEEPSQRTLKTEDFNVTGIQYYVKNISKLAISNKEYRSKSSVIVKNGNAGKKIFQYDYVNKPVKLEPEPKNPHDKNAIKVIIAGELVGYIPSESCLHVKDILKKHEIKYLTAFISGGDYKIVSENEDIFKGEYKLKINIRIAYV